MIDVNDLDGLLELANDYVDDGLHFLTEPVSYGDLVILVERIIAAEKDAARYRWLRDDANYHKHSGALVFITDSNGNIDDFNGHSGVLSGMDLDHEVDEAMQCNK